MPTVHGAAELALTAQFYAAGRSRTSHGSAVLTLTADFSARGSAFSLVALTSGSLTLSPVTPPPDPIVVVKAMKANGALDSAYASLDLSDVQEVWATMALGLTSELISFYTADGEDRDTELIQMRSNPRSHELYLIDPEVQGGPWTGLTVPEFGTAPAPAEGWQLCEMHFDDGVLREVFIDGTQVWSVVPDPVGGINQFTIGVVSASPNDTPCVVYFANVKAGTTRGGSDLFADDFSSGNFSLWTSTFGDLSVVDNPFGPPAATFELTPRSPNTLTLVPA